MLDQNTNLFILRDRGSETGGEGGDAPLAWRLRGAGGGKKWEKETERGKKKREKEKTIKREKKNKERKEEKRKKWKKEKKERRGRERDGLGGEEGLSI